MYIKERKYKIKLFNDHKAYTKPSFDGETIIGESFMPVYKKGEDGEMVLHVGLLYKKCRSFT